MNRNLIINADDFGFSDHTVDWTIKCFEAGVLSSATIMVGAVAVERAVEFAKQNPQWSFGLHLCLTDERPISNPSDIPTMVTDDGLLLPTRLFMLRSSLGMIKRKHVEAEIRAQVQRLREFGISMSHLDGHGHMHRMPFVLKSLIQLSKEMGIKSIRPAQDLYFTSPMFPVVKWLNRWVNRTISSNFLVPDHFLMTSGKIEIGQDCWFRDIISRLPDGCTELGVHPGVDEPWRKLDTEFLIREGVSVLSTAGITLKTYHSFT